jgi:hypothetical protein
MWNVSASSASVRTPYSPGLTGSTDPAVVMQGSGVKSVLSPEGCCSLGSQC